MLNEPRQRVTTYPGTGQVVTVPGASCNVHGWPLVCSLRVISHVLKLHSGIIEHSEETPASSKY